jgi:hypothetical protein
MKPLSRLSLRPNACFTLCAPSLYKSHCKRHLLHIRKPRIRIRGSSIPQPCYSPQRTAASTSSMTSRPTKYAPPIWRANNTRKDPKPYERLRPFPEPEGESDHETSPERTEPFHDLEQASPRDPFPPPSNFGKMNPQPISDLDLDLDLESAYSALYAPAHTSPSFDPTSSAFLSPSQPSPSAFESFESASHNLLPSRSHPSLSSSSLTPSENSLLKPTTFFRFCVQYGTSLVNWMVGIDLHQEGLYTVGRTVKRQCAPFIGTSNGDGRAHRERVMRNLERQARGCESGNGRAWDSA